MRNGLLRREGLGVPALQERRRLGRALRVDDGEQLVATRIAFDAPEPEREQGSQVF